MSARHLTMTTGPTPSFAKPPVIETVLGVEFTPLEGWDVRHFGLYWQVMEAEFSAFEVHHPISSTIESFEKPVPTTPSVSMQVVDRPELRGWYLSTHGRELIQLQDNRFIFNWRKLDSDAPYPRYDEFVRPAFERHWPVYLKFLQDRGLGFPQVVQCEVTYVNHLPKGLGWESASDWPRVFRGLECNSVFEFLPPPEAAQFNANFLFPDHSGRLRVSAAPAVRNEDGVEIIKLVLTARGRPRSSELPALLEWFKLGHDWVVRGFADLTTPQMHQLWGRER